MIHDIVVFDCTLREAGYQTGWFFDEDFARAYYEFAQKIGFDYLELGFFHDKKADPNRGNFRYCSLDNDKITEIFAPVKKKLKLSAMRDIQRPLSGILPKEKSLIDTVRILTRSKETNFNILQKHIDELRSLGYELFINFTSAGENSMAQNQAFAKFAKSNGIGVIYFADTESIFTPEFIKDTIAICNDEGVKVGFHLHNKQGKANVFLDLALAYGSRFTDITLMGLGGKWYDGNVSTEYFLQKFGFLQDFELTKMKTALIENLIKYQDSNAAVKDTKPLWHEGGGQLTNFEKEFFRISFSYSKKFFRLSNSSRNFAKVA